MSEAAGDPPRGSWALVVTNDEVLRARAIEGLGAAGISCDTAQSGIEALASIEGTERDYTLLVLDLDLGDVPAREIELIAETMTPLAAVITCGAGPSRPGDGRCVSVKKPALASEFARAVARLRARPVAADVIA